MIEYKNVSLANQVFERIEFNILSGVYERGEVISEKRLSQELGVSRTPIREALGRLNEDNLVTESPNGTVVIGISDSDVEDFYIVKRNLEVIAAARAAEAITDEALKEIKSIIDQQEFFATKNDVDKVRDLDTDLHDVIYAASGSRVLGNILERIHRKLLKYRRASLTKDERLHQSIAEHKAIYEALSCHDKEKARAAVTKHVENSYKRIRERGGEA